MLRRRSRREFLADAVKATAGASIAAGCFPDVGGRWPPIDEACVPDELPSESDGLVVEHFRDDAVLVTTDSASGQKAVAVQAVVVRQMLDEALAELALGAAEPWKALLPDWTPETRIGIKVNCLNPTVPTSPVLARALVDSLRAGLGVAADKILVWDRLTDELTSRGFTEQTMGVPVRGTLATRDDAAQGIVSGPGYGDTYCRVVGGRLTRLSRILTELTDVTINCPVLKGHEVSGVTAALKNIYGVIDNPGDFHDNLATAMPALYKLAPVRTRVRLTVLDALVAVATGGTAGAADCEPKRIIVSKDPLAADAYALDLINRLRAASSPAVGPVDGKFTGWLEEARRLGLGSLEYRLVALGQAR